MQARPMTTIETVQDAKARIFKRAPFYGVCGMRLGIVEQSDEECPTMATDGVSVFVSAGFVASVTRNQLMGTTVHEIRHCTNRHFSRRGNRDPLLWNYAGDYEINPGIIADGWELPPGALNDPRFYGMVAEQIYAILHREREERKERGEPEPELGNIAGEVRDAPRTMPGTGETVDKPLLEAQWKETVKSAVNTAKREGKSKGVAAGDMPGGIEALADTLAHRPNDWRAQLREFIDASASRGQTSMSRPNRRHLWRNIILPGRVPDRPAHAVFAIDTSSSMDVSAVKSALIEAQSALDDGAADKITIVYCNTSVWKIEECEPGDFITLDRRVGGGTDFADAQKKIADMSPSCIVWLTDGGTSDWGINPGAPVLWCVTDHAGGRYDKMTRENAPFGRVITMY